MALRPGERIQEVESAGELLLQLGLQRMVDRRTGAPGNLHIAEPQVGAARIEREFSFGACGRAWFTSPRVISFTPRLPT